MNNLFHNTVLTAYYSLDSLICQLDNESRYDAEGVDRKDSLIGAMNTLLGLLKDRLEELKRQVEDKA